jgi:Tol biopolymer transport system component
MKLPPRSFCHTLTLFAVNFPLSFGPRPAGFLRGKNLTLAVGLLGLLAAVPGRAQTAQEPFGRVRIQYKKFAWSQFSTQNFNVYYYAGGEASARRTAQYAEQELQRITALVGYFPYSKTTLMLYNSVGDLRQSNINLPVANAVSGGEAQLARQTKVEVAFTGRQTDFKRDLSYQITQVLLNDMMYGGSLREVLQSNYLLQLPGWFVDGASAYAAEGWSVDMDAYMRDMVREYPNGNRTAPFFLRNPRLAGHSIWNYIAERYGYGTVQNVLNLTRITRDVEVGIASSLNVPFKVFLRNWIGYYRDINTGGSLNSLVVPTEANRISSRNKRGLEVFSQPVFSPDGQHLAYAVNDQGRYRVVVANRDGSHRRTLLHGGYRTPDQQIETRLPVLAWRGNSQLAVAELLHGRMVLRLRDALSLDLAGRIGRTLRLKPPTTIFAPYDQVLDMNYSADGKALVFTAVQKGQNDIYLLRAGSRQPERLTDDLFDDQQAVFMPGGQAIAFSSNRYLDSTGRARPATFPNVVNNYDLFLCHLDGRAVPIESLVSTISNETRPRPLSDDEIVYLGEENGIRGLFRYSRKTKQHQPVSNFAYNIQDFDVSLPSGALAFIPQVQARDQLYLYPQFPLPESLAVGKTSRQRILENRSQPAPAPVRPAATTPAAPTPTTTATGTVPAAGTVPATTTPASPAAPASPTTPRRSATAPLNPNNYQFEEDEDVAPQRPRRSARATPATSVATRAATPTVTGPYRYDTRFMADNLVTGVAIDPLLGFGFSLQANLSDAFENQRFQASVFAQLDLRTSNINLSYTNVTRRFDWSVAYQKQAYFFDAGGAGEQFRYGRHSLAPTLAYPLTHNLSLRGGPRYDNIARSLTGVASTENDLNRNYLGFNAELVFDNSRATGVNMLLGTRLKAGVLQMNNIGNKGNNFGKFYIDLRHYQKLHRSLVWANRVSYGQFFGAAEAGDNPQQVFRLGGMDNWVNQQYAGQRLLTPPGQTSPDPTSIFYQQFVTNLRGFDLSRQTGTRYVLFNSELRFPIVQYFSNKPIYSGFFRNLQLIGFFDAGTAYRGTNPFGDDNSNATVRFGGNGNPFSGTVTSYTSPLLMGYGVGIRSTVLGFYTKFDLAWAKENYITSKPKPYFTLGHDF